MAYLKSRGTPGDFMFQKSRVLIFFIKKLYRDTQYCLRSIELSPFYFSCQHRMCSNEGEQRDNKTCKPLYKSETGIKPQSTYRVTDLQFPRLYIYFFHPGNKRLYLWSGFMFNLNLETRCEQMKHVEMCYTHPI